MNIVNLKGNIMLKSILVAFTLYSMNAEPDLTKPAENFVVVEYCEEANCKETTEREFIPVEFCNPQIAIEVATQWVIVNKPGKVWAVAGCARKVGEEL